MSIDVLQPLFPATNGYGAMWIGIGVPILLSLPFLAALRSEEAEVEAIPVPAAALDDLALAA